MLECARLAGCRSVSERILGWRFCGQHWASARSSASPSARSRPAGSESCASSLGRCVRSPGESGPRGNKRSSIPRPAGQQMTAWDSNGSSACATWRVRPIGSVGRFLTRWNCVADRSQGSCGMRACRGRTVATQGTFRLCWGAYNPLLSLSSARDKRPIARAPRISNNRNPAALPAELVKTSSHPESRGGM
jgi:hypothetical protein